MNNQNTSAAELRALAVIYHSFGRSEEARKMLRLAEKIEKSSSDHNVIQMYDWRQDDEKEA